MSKPHRLTHCRMVVLIALLLALPILASGEKDPHRPPCASSSCKAIKRFLRSHYCGESPFGNGPANGCDMRELKKENRHAASLAAFDCSWNDQMQASVCKQAGKVPVDISQSLLKELHRLGMPASNDKKVMYQMLQFGDLSIAEASYSHVKGENLWLCQVIAIFSSSSQFRVVRWLRYQKTEADVPTVTTWDPIDIADVNGDGKPEIVLRGDAYEDHWFEVLGVNPDLSTNLLFSGLGYYL